MSDPVRLPSDLALKVRSVREHHIEKLADILMQHFPNGGEKSPHLLFVDLRRLTEDTLLAISEAAYSQGLATAGDARQAIEDLETLRAAARILARGSQ